MKRTQSTAAHKDLSMLSTIYTSLGPEERDILMSVASLLFVRHRAGPGMSRVLKRNPTALTAFMQGIMPSMLAIGTRLSKPKAPKDSEAPVKDNVVPLHRDAREPEEH